MENSQALLALLADAEYRSGAEIGRQLGISRAAVWWQVTRLREEGIEIEACNRRGYRLASGMSLLVATAIESSLTNVARSLLGVLDVVGTVPSTNELAMARARQGGADGYVCVAECQSAGKGRRGRTWVSPFARNIYLSTVWRFSGGAAAVEGLSLAVGIAVAKALQGLGYSGVQLKWPNDILWQRRKLGGILLEMAGDPADICDVIVGIGINANMSTAAGAQIDQAWVDLQAVAQSRVDRNRVVSALLNELLPLLASYEATGFSRYQLQWQMLDAFRDQTIVLNAGPDAIEGTARGVTAGGALLIDTPAGRRSVSGGEISLRGG